MDDANNERMTVGTLFVVLPKISCFIQWMIILIYIESSETFSTRMNTQNIEHNVQTGIMKPWNVVKFHLLLSTGIFIDVGLDCQEVLECNLFHGKVHEKFFFIVMKAKLFFKPRLYA